MDPSPPTSSNTPPAIPGYHLLKKLPGGRSNDIYLAQQTNFERHVAIKLAPTKADRAQPQDDASHERLVREARIAARLNHPNIIRVYDLGELVGHRYLSMEYFAGGDLKRRLHYDWSVERSLNVVRQVASALDHVHNKGYIHSNISPDHILLNPYDKAILSNFSLAQSTRIDQPTQNISIKHAGSLQYRSPEQVSGNILDGRTDFYSLGIVLYEMLMGTLPFDHPDITSLSMMILKAPVPNVGEALAPLQPVINRLLSKDIATRYASGRELTADLDQLQNDIVHCPLQRKNPQRERPVDHLATAEPGMPHLSASEPAPPSEAELRASNHQRSETAAHGSRPHWQTIGLLMAILASAFYYLHSSGQLQRWADAGVTSTNPQVRMVTKQLLNLLPGIGNAKHGVAANTPEQQRQLLALNSVSLGAAVGSQIPPGSMNGSMIATGAALALGDIIAHQKHAVNDQHSAASASQHEATQHPQHQ